MLVKGFEDRVEKQPDKIALKAGTGFITYHLLNRLANRIAWLIEKECPGPEVNERVGLLFDHGVDMIAAILGTLKAGKVYVPLSADYPERRLSYMLADSGSSLLLTHSKHQQTAQRLANETGIKFVALDREVGKVPDHNLRRQIKSKELAYIMYTSGSTGKPKGVMQTHENVIYFINNWIEKFSLTGLERLTLFSSFCHDASIPDLFAGLHSGAILYPYSMKSREESIEISQFLVKERIHIWHSVPSLFSYFATTLAGDELFKDLRLIILGGEAVREHEVRLFKKFFPCAELANLYGQTEATFVSVQLIGHEDNFVRVTIGTPIHGTQVFVIDEEGNPAEPLEPGEILVVCPHVSPGYWNNQEATEAVFGEEEGFGRLYWTGDLGCLLPEGEIEFQGRKDFQVKIRGFRIELGEIESRLLEHDNISAAAAAAREDKNNDKYLCAYFVGASGNAVPTAAELRDFLSQILPDYMIPTTFMQLESLPLTPTGKIDRKALPDPVILAEGTYVPPGNPVEKKLAALWAEVLGLEEKIIGINHNFFSLGGHSLKAVSLVAKIHRLFNVKLPLALVFKIPTIRGIASSIPQAAADRFSAITPIEKREYYDLSSTQKRLYFLQQLDISSTGYNMPYYIPLAGNIDIKKIEETFKKLLARHESLRTSFIMINEEPEQRIHQQVEFTIPPYRYEKRLDTDTLVEYIRRDFVKSFNLARAPLMRAVLVEVDGTSKRTLFLDMHHIITDGTSQIRLESEFMSLYHRETLAPLRLHYKDFSQWQNRQEQRLSLKEQEQYWMSIFPDEPAILNLPTDFPRPLMQGVQGNIVYFVISETHTRTLKEEAQQAGATLYMSLLTIYTILLHKLSGQEEIIVGTPIAARRHQDLEPIIGMFVNTLAMRNYPSHDKTFRRYLKEIKNRTLMAYENQEYQFEDLVEKVSVPRDTGRNPIFDVMLNLLNREEYTGQIPGTDEQEEFENRYRHRSATAKFDLNLAALDLGTHIACTFEYSTALFKPHTIERFITYLHNILQAVTINPGIRLADIDILTSKEKEEILQMAAGTTVEHDETQSIHHLFQQQAAQTPHQVAVVYHDRQLTYKVLAHRVKYLAAQLKQRGVKSDTIVGLMVERSPELVIGLLAILQAGGAYLPIDVQYPQERKAYMLRDSSVRLIFTNYHPENPIEKGVEALNIDNDDIYHMHTCTGDPRTGENTAAGSKLIYVIYTSGSTGKPKGVMLEQRNLVNLMRHQLKCTNVEHSKVLQFTSISFDVSFQEIFSALLSGGTLYLIHKDLLANIPDLFRVIARHQIKTLFMPMSFLKLIFSEEEYIRLLPNSITHILTAGEQAVVNSRFKDYLKGSGVHLHNHYGPSEAHVVTTLTLNPEGEIPQLPSIGKPVLNTSIYIMDRAMHLLPIGIAGELYIGGIQVCRGYLNNPELTAEKFERADRNLWDYREGYHRSYRSYMSNISYKSYIYRTGDFARWLPDNNIQFLGRIDNQVKIRGFRIETGEIESRLLTHHDIKEAVVIEKHDHSGDKCLCAYIVSGSPVMDLETYLSRWLPDYMIPSYFVPLEKIPLTANGKVDRNALPEIQLKSKQTYIPPRDNIEKKLLEIWAGILGRNHEISINDNFFKLGGHSLKATNLVYKIEKELKINMPLVEIFNRPELQQMADYIRNRLKETGLIKQNHLILLKQGKNSSNHLFFIHDGTGEVEAYIEFCHALDTGYNYWGIKANQFQDFAPKNLTVEEMAAQYINSIEMIQPDGPYSIAGWSMGGIIAFEMVRQLEQMSRPIDFLALIDSPFPNRDPAKPPQTFTLEQELDWIKNYLPVDIYEKTKQASQTNLLWQLIVRQLEIKNLDEKKVRGILAQLGGRAISNYKYTNIFESIRYLNILRSLIRARDIYFPKGKINTPIHYFKAVLKDDENSHREHRGHRENHPSPRIENWKHYSLQTTFYEVQGDHYSIFKSPHVDHIAKTFEQIMKK